MRSTSLKILVFPISALALALGSLLDWDHLASLPSEHWIGLGAFVGLGVLAEYLAIPLVVGRNKGASVGTYSIIFVLLFASVIVLGPAATVVVTVTAHLITEFWLHRKHFDVATYNVAQQALSAAAAGLAFLLLGGTPDPNSVALDIPSFLGFAATHSLVNLGAASAGIASKHGLGVRDVVRKLCGPRGANLLYDLLVTPLAILIAFFYCEFWVWGLIGVIFVLLWVRRSYIINFRLQQSNRDLLKALVKAIETRDPYTSGHSMRVAGLAAQVAEALHLPAREVENIETAALLHDVGKIDAIYSDILKKKGGLSHEEMEIIKSHVDKGVELLESLTSFPSDIIAAIRHHHERYDGSGYPDALSGTAIPLGARIIKVSDAVDAMLSDRPYRKALSLSDVREQLLLFSEREFDPTLASLFFKEDLLERHAASLESRGREPEVRQVREPAGRV